MNGLALSITSFWAILIMAVALIVAYFMMRDSDRKEKE